MDESKRTVIVVGAGIVGAAIAFELQRRGRAGDVGGQRASQVRAPPSAIWRASHSISPPIPAVHLAQDSELADPEGPVWLRPSYAPKMLPWFLRFVAAGRPLGYEDRKCRHEAFPPCTRRFQDDARRHRRADLMTEEVASHFTRTGSGFTGDRGHIDLIAALWFRAQGSLRRGNPRLRAGAVAEGAKAVLLPDNRSIRGPIRLVLKLVDAAKALGASLCLRRGPDRRASGKWRHGRGFRRRKAAGSQ